jgi:hypothetical protein
MSGKDPRLDHREVIRLQQLQRLECNGRAGFPVHIALERLIGTIVRVLLGVEAGAAAAAAPGGGKGSKEQDRKHAGKGHFAPTLCVVPVRVCVVGFECGGV